MVDRRVESVDDLSYEWPPDVLHYETRYFLGLTMSELLIVSLPAVLLTPFAGIAAGAVCALAGLLLVKRFEAFGGRSLPLYLIAWLRHARQRETIIRLPLILPPGEGGLIITTWEGKEVMRIGGEED